MNRPKSIQIDYQLFLDLCDYADRNADPDDAQFLRLVQGVQQKLDAMLKHDMYSLYKSGTSEEIRIKAREQYLELAGIPYSFRWTVQQDMNISQKGR